MELAKFSLYDSKTGDRIIIPDNIASNMDLVEEYGNTKKGTYDLYEEKFIITQERKYIKTVGKNVLRLVK